MAILQAKAVTKRYRDGLEALRRVDLEIQEGETVSLIGESGSGKTTLLRMFNRLVEPSEGDVSFRGKPIQSQDPVQLRRHVGYVQQEGGLLPHWTVAQNVGLVPGLQGWDRDRIVHAVTEALSLVGLPSEQFGPRFPRRLSGGQRQRVAIARALAAEPEVVLLDEPFGALDPLTRGDLQEEFLSLKQRLRKTMVLVTHDIEEAFLLSDRVGVMQAGRMEQVGSPEELQKRPATPYVERLLARHVRRGNE